MPFNYRLNIFFLIWLEARLDTDGNVMTKEDAQVSELLGPLVGEQKEVQLTISAKAEEPEKETLANDTQITGSLRATGAPQGTIFLIARRAKEAKGPPVAVRKLVANTFPISFSLGKEHLMMGGDWPEEVWLEARLDLDGDAMSKDDNDWYAKGQQVKGNAQDVTLELLPIK